MATYLLWQPTQRDKCRGDDHPCALHLVRVRVGVQDRVRVRVRVRLRVRVRVKGQGPGLGLPPKTSHLSTPTALRTSSKSLDICSIERREVIRPGGERYYTERLRLGPYGPFNTRLLHKDQAADQAADASVRATRTCSIEMCAYLAMWR